MQETLGLTVFMVTHDLDSLYSIRDRVAALADGKMIAAGLIETLPASDHPWRQAYFHGRSWQPLDWNAFPAERRNMETRLNIALIGAFTVAIVFAVFGFVYWLSGLG